MEVARTEAAQMEEAQMEEALTEVHKMGALLMEGQQLPPFHRVKTAASWWTLTILLARVQALDVRESVSPSVMIWSTLRPCAWASM